MTKTKIILVILAMSLVLMSAVRVTYAQYVNTQNQAGAYSQTPKATWATTETCHLTPAAAIHSFHSKVLTPIE